MNDDQIISRIIHGDKSIFDELFVQLYDVLCQYSFSIVKSEHEAEDIVQEVFINLWSGRSKLDIQTNLRAYLYRSVRNQSIDALRKKATRNNIIEQIAQSDNAEYKISYVHPSESVDDEIKRLSILVANEAEKLPDRCREIYFLKHRDGLTIIEISEILDLSQKTVEMRLRDALIILRNKLRGRII